MTTILEVIGGFVVVVICLVVMLFLTGFVRVEKFEVKKSDLNKKDKP